jgi:hypothetical protein
MSRQRRSHQRGATERRSRVDLGAVFEKKPHAGRVVFGDAGGAQERGHGIGDIRRSAVVEEELGERPVGIGAGNIQRGVAIGVDGVDVDFRVEQQRCNDRILAACRVMQRRVADGVRRVGISAVGEQRRHCVGAAFVAVARRGDERRDATVHAVDVGAFRDQRAQRAQVRQRHRDHQRRALVAGIESGLCIRRGAVLDGIQRKWHLSRTQCAQQGFVELGLGDVGRKHPFGGAVDEFRDDILRLVDGLMRVWAHVREPCAQSASQQEPVCQRRYQQRVNTDNRDAVGAGKREADAGNRERTDRKQCEHERGRQPIAKENVRLRGEFARLCNERSGRH